MRGVMALASMYRVVVMTLMIWGVSPSPSGSWAHLIFQVRTPSETLASTSLKNSWLNEISTVTSGAPRPSRLAGASAVRFSVPLPGRGLLMGGRTSPKVAGWESAAAPEVPLPLDEMTGPAPKPGASGYSMLMVQLPLAVSTMTESLLNQGRGRLILSGSAMLNLNGSGLP